MVEIDCADSARSKRFLDDTTRKWYELLNVPDEIQVRLSDAAFKRCTGLTIDWETESLPGLFARTKDPNCVAFSLSRTTREYCLAPLRDAITLAVTGGFFRVDDHGSIVAKGQPLFGGRPGRRTNVFVTMKDRNPLTRRECVFFEVLMEYEK